MEGVLRVFVAFRNHRLQKFIAFGRVIARRNSFVYQI
jgi:hypothetical protein